MASQAWIIKATERIVSTRKLIGSLEESFQYEIQANNGHPYKENTEEWRELWGNLQALKTEVTKALTVFTSDYGAF